MSETAINDGANDRIRDMAQEIYQSLVTDIAAGDRAESSVLLLDATLRQFRHDTIAELLKEEAQLQASGQYLPGLPDARASIVAYVQACYAWGRLYYITGKAQEEAARIAYQRLQAAWSVLQAMAQEGRDA